MVVDRITLLLAEHKIPEHKWRSTLADICGLSTQGIKNWFDNAETISISAEHLMAIARHFGCSMEWLLSGDDDEKSVVALVSSRDRLREALRLVLAAQQARTTPSRADTLADVTLDIFQLLAGGDIVTESIAATILNAAERKIGSVSMATRGASASDR